MVINSKMMIGDVTAITKQYCDLVDCDFVNEGNHEVYCRDIKLLDDDKLNTYTTIFCCKVEDRDKAFSEIDAFNGKKKEDYKFNNQYCHIATYKKDDEFYVISFDNEEECGVHANFNKEYKFIEAFFVKFIKFRKDLIENDMVVKDDDLYQYFLSVVKGFDERNSVTFIDKILQKIMRRN